MKEIEQDRVIESIKSGDQSILQQLYLDHRPGFVEWATVKFACSTEEALDIYQDVVIVFYENIVQEKIQSLTGSVRNYLFGIGKYKLLERYRKQSKSKILDEQYLTSFEPKLAEPSVEKQIELSERQALIKQILENMGSPCQEIITWFYFHRFSMEAMMARLNYKSTDVVKSQKARCMRNLKRFVAEKSNLDLQE